MSQQKRETILRLATRQDLPRIDQWLVQPDMRRWWGCPVDTQCEMRLGLFCSPDTGRIYLVLGRNNEPIGLVSMIHGTAFVGSRLDWSKYLPLDAWEIGILIGSKRNRQRGLGARALIEVQGILAGHSGAPVFAWIEKDNAASLATFIRLGYDRVDKPEISSYSTALFRYDHDRTSEYEA